MLHPKIDSTIEDYVVTKIDDQETKLVHEAMQLRINLKARGSLPSNGILPVKAKPFDKNKLVQQSLSTLAYSTIDRAEINNKHYSSDMKRVLSQTPKNLNTIGCEKHATKVSSRIQTAYGIKNSIFEG